MSDDVFLLEQLRKVLNDPELSLQAKGLMAYVLCKPDGWIAGNENIEAELQEPKYLVYSLIRSLYEYSKS